MDFNPVKPMTLFTSPFLSETGRRWKEDQISYQYFINKTEGVDFHPVFWE